MAGHDSINARQVRAELCHPFFDTADPPSSLDCLDAIDRMASVVELFCHLKLDSEEGGLSPAAVSGYLWLSETLKETLLYTSRRLSRIAQRRGEDDREKAMYETALLESLSELDDADRGYVLNAMAARLGITRPEVDAYVDSAIAE